MKPSTVFSSFMFVFIGLQQYSESVTETSCVESGYPQSVTLRCSQQDDLIVTRSAFYARLPLHTRGFCERPTVDGNRGDCVPHADFYGDHVANSCNANHSCRLYTSSSRPNIVSACSNVTGQVYFTANFDCVQRKKYGGSDIDFVYVSDVTNVVVSHIVYIFSSLYPSQTALSSNKCQMRLPANADAHVQLLDLRGTSSSTVSCPYQMYIYSGVSRVYRQWCATRGPSESWQQTFYLYSSNQQAQTVDIVVDRKVVSATGALWIAFEARLKDGQPAQGISIICGPSVRLQPLPFSSSSTITATRPTPTTTTTTTTPYPTTTSTTTTTTPTTTTTTTTPLPTTTSTTTTTTSTTTTTTPRPTTRSTTTTLTTTTTTTTTPSTRSTTSTSSTTIPTGSSRTSTSRGPRSSGTSTATSTITTATTDSGVDYPRIIGIAVTGGVLLLVVIIVAVLVARNRRQAKLRRLSKMLPDVIGTWKYDGNRGDPGGSGPDSGLDTGLHELQPVSSAGHNFSNPIYLEPQVEETVITPTAESPQVYLEPQVEQAVVAPTVAPPPPVKPASPSSYKSPDPIYLEPRAPESAVEEPVIVPAVASPPALRRTSILFDPSSMERQNSGGQVRFVTPEDGTIQYPGHGTSLVDDDRHDWHITRAQMNARDRHPNSFGDRGSRTRGSPPPTRPKAAKLPPPSLSSPRVTALQAGDTETQQNPLYGASMDLFSY